VTWRDGQSRKDTSDVRVVQVAVPIQAVTRDRAVRDFDRASVAAGRSPGRRLVVRRTGVLAGIGTAYKDIANQGDGTVVQPSAATVYVWSAEAADTAAGTGVRTVTLGGIQATTGALVEETVSMNGTTVVASAYLYDAILYARPASVGSAAAQAGVISFGTANKGTTWAKLTASSDDFTGEIQHAWDRVPTGYVLVLDRARVGMLDTTAVGAARLQVKATGSVWRTIALWGVAAGVWSTFDFEGVEAIPAGSIVRLQGKTGADTDTFFGTFTGILVPV